MTTDGDATSRSVWSWLLQGLAAFIVFVVWFELILWLDDLRDPCEELGCLWPIIPPILATYGLAVYVPLGLGLLAWERWGQVDAPRYVAQGVSRVLWVTAAAGPPVLLLFG